MHYCGKGWCPRKACAKAVVGRKVQPAQVAERRQDESAGGADGRSAEERKGQMRLHLEDHLIWLDLYSKSRGKPLVVPWRSQQEKICYEAFCLAVVEKRNWGVGYSVCWGTSLESMAVDQSKSDVI